MPPRFGTLDLAKFAKSVSAIDGYKTDPLTLKECGFNYGG